MSPRSSFHFCASCYASACVPATVVDAERCEHPGCGWRPECRACGGEGCRSCVCGRIPLDWIGPCDECRGEGTRFDEEQGRLRDCRACGGHGEFYPEYAGALARVRGETLEHALANGAA